MDLTNKRISISLSRQQRIDGGEDQWRSENFINRSVTIIDDPDGISGSYELSMENFSPDEVLPIKFRLIPVNSGNTYLLQGKSVTGTTGVCQKV